MATAQHISNSDRPRKRRTGRPRTTSSRMTSVKLNEHDMALLERVAEAQDASFAEVWRRALHVYAHEIGLSSQAQGSTGVRAA